MSGEDIELLVRDVIGQGYRLHLDVGPGLLETVYETVLADRLRGLGFFVETQKSIDINIDGKIFPGAFRADLIINRSLLIELKSVESLNHAHIKQTLTYIKLLGFPLGLLMNFGGATYKVRCSPNNERYGGTTNMTLFSFFLRGFYELKVTITSLTKSRCL